MASGTKAIGKKVAKAPAKKVGKVPAKKVGKVPAKKVGKVAAKSVAATPAKAPAKPVAAATADKGPNAGVLRYALAAARTRLGWAGPEAEVTEDAGQLTFFCHGVRYAGLRVEGNDLVVSLLEPKKMGELDAKLGFYEKGPDAGWLVWRTAVSRDPRPWLDASVGPMVGTVLHEILQGGRRS